MKKISIFFTCTLLLVLVLFFACKKEKTTDDHKNATGSVLFWTASDLGCGNITVECNNQTKVITSYFSNGAPACGSSGAASFTMEPGTYAYTASCNSKTWSGTVTITENNCFKIQFTDGAGGSGGSGGTGGSTTGQAMFWSATDLGCGNITVNVNGVTRTLSSYYSNGAPSCGAAGCANFDLSPGSYSYSASCSSKTWNGTVSVTAGACSKVQFTGGSTGGSTTGKALFWIASDLACGNITVTCNGISRSVSSYYSSGAPDCGASGCANFDLSPGTYSYSAQCSSKTWSGSITVSAGGCSKLQLTGGSGGGSTSGKAMFWTSSDLGCGTITVTCNGVTSSISSYYSSGAPSCGASGCANFSFSPGTYSYSGKCSSKTWNGTVTITANGCSTIRFTN